MRKHYERILRQRKPRAALSRYPDFGREQPLLRRFPKADSLVEPKTAIYRATTMTACYLNPESRYYLDAELSRPVAGAGFARRSQRPLRLL